MTKQEKLENFQHLLSFVLFCAGNQRCQKEFLDGTQTGHINKFAEPFLRAADRNLKGAQDVLEAFVEELIDGKYDEPAV